MKCEFGFCSVCEKEIAPKCSHCDTRKPGEHYTQVEVTWSNGSKMLIAVCVDCAKESKYATAHAKAGLTQAHQDYWTSQGGTFDKGVVIV